MQQADCDRDAVIVERRAFVATTSASRHFFDFRQYQNPNPTPMQPSSKANQSEPRNEDASASMANLLLGVGASEHDAHLATGAERRQEGDEQEDRCLVGGHFWVLFRSVYATAPTTMTAPPMET
jgi:hypothetical protein